MALITCAGCGHDISPHTPACPHCGTPVPAALYRPPTEYPAPETPAAEYPAGGHASGGYASPGYASTGYASPGHAPETPAAGGYAPQGYAAGGYPAPGMYPAAFEAQRQAAQMVYMLYAGGMLFGPLLIAALVMAYIRRGEGRGPWADAHYTWIIETFWATMAVGVCAGAAAIILMLLFFPMAIFLCIAAGFFGLGWPIYRLVVGYSALTNGRTPVGSISAPRW